MFFRSASPIVPTTIYGIPSRSRISMAWRTMTLCFTAHSPRHFPLNLHIRPLRVPCLGAACDEFARHVIQPECDGEPLGRSHLSQDVGDSIVDDFNLAGIEAPACHDP